GDDSRPRTGRDHDSLEVNSFFTAVGFFNFDRVRIFEARISSNVLNFSGLRYLTEAAGKLVDHAFFERPEPRNIDLWFAKLYTPIFCVAGLVDQLGHVQQGFRRDTSAVQTHAAGILFAINQCYLHAQISREKCSRVSARAATDYRDILL